jgi:hypothetical protein
MTKKKFDSAAFMERAKHLSELEAHIIFGCECVEPKNGLSREEAYAKLSKPAKAFFQHFNELSQTEIAELTGVTPAAICQSDCPRNIDGTYSFTAVFWYKMAKAKAQ